MAIQSQYVLVIAIGFSHIVGVTQQISVLAKVDVLYGEPVETDLRVASLLTFDLEVNRLGCVGTLSALGNFICEVCIVLVGVVTLLGLHYVLVFVRHGGNFKSRHVKLISSIGNLAT
jgi:hypothetical protein